MAIIKDENFILIQGWMINNLKLSGNDLLVYAIIYGFTQDGEQWFEGSRSYLGEWCNSTKQGIQKNLKRLIERNLILKKETFINNVKFCKYKVNPEYTPRGGGNVGDVSQFTTGKLSLPGATVTPSKQSLPGGRQQSLLGGRQQSCPYNIDIDNIDINNIVRKKEINKERKFSPQQVESNKKENLDFEKTQVLDSAINGKKISDSKKSKTFDQLIEEYTTNEKLRQELKEHLKTRKLKKAALTDRGVKLSLQKLDNLASNDQEKIMIVQNAIMNGWTSFYPLKKDEHNRMINSLSQHKPNYDIEAYIQASKNMFDSLMDEKEANKKEFVEVEVDDYDLE